MTESTMQYLVSLPDDAIEKVNELAKGWGISRDAVITQAIYYFYQSNERPLDRRINPEEAVVAAASSIAMSILQRTLNEGGTIRIPSPGITIGPREEG